MAPEKRVHPSRVTPTVGPYWVTGVQAEEVEVPDWAQARADQGLCAMVDGWCITHGVADDTGHYYAVRYAENPRHDFGD